MNKKVAAFLLKHNFPINQDINSVVDSLLFDMNEGLCNRPSGQDMIKTYSEPPLDSPRNKSVISIDAGGTNFRSCLVTFDQNGLPTINDMQKTKMPGVEKELSKKEFFDAFALNLEHLKDKASNIGFCFSYPMTITEDGDGCLLGFSKEVKAPEVVGCHIGKELALALKEHGWKNELKISMLNDTSAALLAGAACVPEGTKYSSYIGFILGTGMNGAYIQSPDEKYPELKKQIIVCESGRFDKVMQADFDIAFDKKSSQPKTSLMEKLCSGAYLGPVAYEAISLACEDNLFSKKFTDALKTVDSLTLIEVDQFLHSPFGSSMLSNLLKENATEEDYVIFTELLDALTDRASRMAASILSACAIQSGEGKNPCKPICMLCDGTTFYKTYKVKERIISYLEQFLVRERGIYYEVVSCDNDITLGSAIAGLI